MPSVIKGYVRAIDAMNRFIGRIAMYLIFALVGVLLWSSISKTFFNPSLWTLETAQFVMVAYYILGGPYSIQMGSNVRMDLFYGAWSLKTKAWVDAFTVLFLMFYLGVLFYGAVSSTAYSLGYFGLEPFQFFGDLLKTLMTEGLDAASAKLGYLERSSTAWRPFLWPVKTILCLGVFLMLLQCLAELFRDLGRLRGDEF
ncbi:TRAP transporter small permease subunit [Phaeobacter italicus]|jgi:TRAP-type mannitol/chloroaromatic compound transport system permease small subunit|uniref:TRAP transporter small permease protein n=1 Tax=Phaeobacter italicus TaxID=481446 RepID=A0A0H5D1E4_9RHOB|nr:TRAP transporter small permease subunit [Phaeobacter italicus]EEB72178.1 tripartite ATP-independent periplasmic transporter, DctQ component [Ruegeria sp. R11]MEC8014724.1 TRAP transporter small permease subunit [Pseudomonadota bacterium]NKX39954.1 TRAP transporter small permease subunit [Rhodobacteraceae bacterium R_SAG2]NKX71114.1 TRAP transporter small permease subunit [Rhodobacteraceae bacterium R_SAG1]MCI5101338.1 TRAP transporter small permease subunit [Phaeobacter italicus]